MRTEQTEMNLRC